jgi:hypothetical protein
MICKEQLIRIRLTGPAATYKALTARFLASVLFLCHSDFWPPDDLMSSHSLSQTKNYIRKALWKAADPAPSAKQKEALWEHFQSSCAYCGRPLQKTERKAHLDHLDATGRNHISNRVIACSLCNGDEKREQNWEEFLIKKCGPGTELFQSRRDRILRWQQQCGQPQALNKEVAAKLKALIDRCYQVLDDCHKEVRQMTGQRNIS